MLRLQLVFTSALVLGTLLYLAWEFHRLHNKEGSGASETVHVTEGRWGPHTAPIDWCEENYAVTSTVAEFWNTVTCSFYVAASAQSLLDASSGKGGCPAYYRLFALAHAATGLFSAVFHGTLWWWGQKSDEVLESITLLLLLHMPTNRDVASQRKLMVLHAAIATAIPIFVPEVLTELHVAALVAGILHVYYSLAAARKNSVGAVVLRAAIYGLLGFACWLVDKVACQSLGRAAQVLQLHAWWHLFTALAIYHVGYAALVSHRLSVCPQSETEARKDS
eukprot:TRINITY_DN83831_c0_g1_i1.p1 TRINITY_DN83831_c0_g1~~TRINITY_DN83831_c0_g1_i1.p1  ORF type:complete len:278 (+),score=45.95 TRINITY_DN83831_c0_g1_i1:31-864(+)